MATMAMIATTMAMMTAITAMMAMLIDLLQRRQVNLPVPNAKHSVIFWEEVTAIKNNEDNDDKNNVNEDNDDKNNVNEDNNDNANKGNNDEYNDNSEAAGEQALGHLLRIGD